MHIRTKAIRRLYSGLFILAIPFIIARLLIRSRKQPHYRRRLKERFGFIKPTDHPSIWIHSVSVGETIAAVPLIEKLITQYPQHTIYVTTTTPTGSEQVRLHFAHRVMHSYLPYDINCLLKRFIKRIQPVLSIMMETEVWPNLLFTCKAHNIPTLLANARLSEKSYQGYAHLKHVAGDLFNLFSSIAAQSSLDADHFKQLGVVPHNITITGSIKFDRDISTDITSEATQLRHAWQLAKRPVLIAASTRENEETHILNAFKKIKQTHPECFLLLVPRHPERCDQIAKQCQNYGFSYEKRSQQSLHIAQSDILLGDTIGELFLLYAIADIAFVGGSLVNTGCHNVLEPAALGMPIITGPYIRNFQTICAMLKRAGGQLIINDEDMLAAAVIDLIEHPDKAQEMGQRALNVYESNKGALAKQLELIRMLLLHTSP